jgi:hypothetical protein
MEIEIEIEMEMETEIMENGDLTGRHQKVSSRFFDLEPNWTLVCSGHR